MEQIPNLVEVRVLVPLDKVGLVYAFAAGLLPADPDQKARQDALIRPSQPDAIVTAPRPDPGTKPAQGETKPVQGEMKPVQAETKPPEVKPTSAPMAPMAPTVPANVPDHIEDPHPDKPKVPGTPRFGPVSPESTKWSAATSANDVVHVIYHDEGITELPRVLERFRQVREFCRAAAAVREERLEGRVQRAYDRVKDEIPF